MAETLSEQVAALEAERDAAVKRADYLHGENQASRARLATARVEGARECQKAFVAGAYWRNAYGLVPLRPNAQQAAEEHYPAPSAHAGEEPTRACIYGCGGVNGHAEGCPAPQAVTEPPEDEAWGWAVVNKKGNVATTHGGYPALITVTEARRRGMPRNGGDWIDALCALLNANTGDELAPFTVVRLHAWAALASRPTASGEG